jgi:polyhydroxyalkanoate synthase
LLQYAPRTPRQFKRPLLIVPPWINKYYILDLRPDNSFIRWALDQGHTVFCISWVNPDEKLADKGFDDYLKEGALAALDAVCEQCGVKEVNAVGYCLGGTLLAIAAAYLAKRRDKRLASLTFFTSLLDFKEPGELGVFIDDTSVAALEAKMSERGYLEGSEMAATFNMLRANDLIWSFVVNNYLLGKDPFPFDLLFWNSDSTRMPAKMHAFYLRNMYRDNRLSQPGGIELLGVPIDLGKIKTPAYFISTIEDHIAPWKTCYRGARLLSGPVRFVLGGSGHIAGIVNPPTPQKYGYWDHAGDELPEAAEAWLEQATQHPGSWWPDWQRWVTSLGAEQVAARDPVAGPLGVIADAPGRYVAARA